MKIKGKLIHPLVSVMGEGIVEPYPAIVNVGMEVLARVIIREFGSEGKVLIRSTDNSNLYPFLIAVNMSDLVVLEPESELKVNKLASEDDLIEIFKSPNFDIVFRHNEKIMFDLAKLLVGKVAKPFQQEDVRKVEDER